MSFGASVPWTPDQDAVLLNNAHLTERELARLASKVGPDRTPTAANKRLRKLLNNARKPIAPKHAWDAKEVEILNRLTPTTSDQEIVKALAEAGFTRTAEGVRRARLRRNLVNERDVEERDYAQGWHPLAGDFAVRDREFVRRVMAEALRLGIARRAA